ncbi:MAG: hypothetical protein QOI11_3555 [Candidatus Eremiobacteraeota bacterium]|jgi:hypothetical protein|nr:hypothetical protein [Candidatus Eremiobacteraeota bacterium]
MAAAGERICFIHAGTHKTATTALQNYLGENDALLAAEGTYYPRCGRMRPNGHHNIAFELSEDERYRPALGTLAELLAEVAAAALPRACISSEGLTFLNDRPDKLAALRDGFAAIGYRAVVLVYLRAQSAYLESLYPTLLRLGYAVSFEEFVERALADGVVRYRGTRSYRFDYADLLERYARVFGADGVIVRRYAKRADPAWIVRDFCAALGLPAQRLERFARGPRLVNERPGLAEAARLLLRNRERAPSPETERLLGRFAGLPFAPLGVLPAARLAGRFGRGNRRVEARWGPRIEPLEPGLLAARAWAALQAGSPQRAARVLMAAVERDSA